MTKKFIRNLTGKHRNRKSDMQLGLCLSLVAGAINAGGFLAVGQYTSHMTGIVSSIADAIALYKYEVALLAIVHIMSFILGAAFSAIIINWARVREFQSEFALALMLEALLLLVFGLFASDLIETTMLSIQFMIGLLCFIMGLQNAIITKVSNAEIRTTHVTGITTDIGIEIGRYITRQAKIATVQTHPDRLKLHVGLLLCFLLGGVMGAFLFKTVGFAATLPFALLLGIMASIPIWDDIAPKAPSGKTK